MTDYINEKKIRDEIAVFLKNQNVLSTTERGVTAVVGTTLGVSLTGTTTYRYINKTNVRNIRRLCIAGSQKTFGTDYTTDYYYLDTTRKCRIDFVGSVTLSTLCDIVKLGGTFAFE